jgi:purine-binding chemotaxis protein CheW
MKIIENKTEQSALEKLVGQYINLRVEERSYLIRIEDTGGVIGLQHITPASAEAEGLLGTMTLQGSTYPVVDLRVRIGLEYKAPTNRTHIVLARVGKGDQAFQAGLIVDEVTGVSSIGFHSIRGIEEYEIDGEGASAVAVADSEGQDAIILNTDILLNSADLRNLANTK